MTDPRKALPGVQARLETLWSRYDLCWETRDKAGQQTNMDAIRDLEAIESELLAEIRSTGVLEKQR